MINECACGHDLDEHDIDGCWGAGEGPNHVDGETLDLNCPCVAFEAFDDEDYDE